MTTTLAVMIAIWGLIVIGFMALMVYRAHLSQFETEQLFLNETVPTHVHQEQDEIVRRLCTVEPLCKVVGAAAIVLAVAIIAVWAIGAFSSAL